MPRHFWGVEETPQAWFPANELGLRVVVQAIGAGLPVLECAWGCKVNSYAGCGIQVLTGVEVSDALHWLELDDAQELLPRLVVVF